MPTVTVSFPESTQRSRSKTVNVPNLGKVTSITANTGNATYTQSGNDLTVSVSNGTATRSTSSSYTPSEYVSTYQTGSSSSFPSSITVSQGGITGSISKSGSAYVISGSEPVTTWKRCEADAAATLTYRYRWTGTSWAFDDSWVRPETTSYSDAEGYSGTLNFARYNGSLPNPPPTSAGDGQSAGYTTTRSTSGTATYSANLTKSTPDTRVWRQDYAGTIYGSTQTTTTYYYAYEVTVVYEDAQIQIGAIKLAGKSGLIEIPVFDINVGMDGKNMLRLSLGDGIGCLKLVPVGDATASPLFVYTVNGIKSIAKKTST